MRGRKPTPAEVKRLTGNPGKRAIGDPVLIGERVYDVPPIPNHLALDDDLTGETDAADLWDGVCAILIDANIITSGDLFAVTMFVESVLESRRAWRALREQGSVVDTANAFADRATTKPNPWHKVWRESNAQMLKNAEHLGLTPVARARLGLAVGHGRKLAKELGDGLPENPVQREGDDSTFEHEDIDLYPKEIEAASATDETSTQ